MNALALTVLTMTTHTAGTTAENTAMSLSSPSFQDGHAIPADFTCDGSGRAFTLDLAGVPSNAKSLVLIMHDPDAPDPKQPSPRGFTHWIAYNVPTSTRSLTLDRLPAGARFGENDDGEAGYMGPCPSIGRHRYVITAYAVDEMLGDLGAPRRAAILEAIEGRVIDKAELTGTYAKPRQRRGS